MSKFHEAVKRLRELRLSNERVSQEVFSLGHFLLEKKQNVSYLGSEVWDIYEQTFIASLDCGEFEFAKSILLKLGQKFPESQRFRRLVGMSLEAQGDFEKALEIYDKMLEEDEAHLPTLKRKIAILKAQGFYKKTILALNDYLNFSVLDKEAWVELSNLYLEDQLFSQAAHCMEELILIEPNNHLYHLKYAEILHTIGNIDIALKQFCRALELCPNHVRALYGIQLCTNKLLANCTEEKRNLLVELNVFSSKLLNAVYSKHAGAQNLRILEDYFCSSFKS